MTDVDKLLEGARAKAETFGQLYGRKETADERLKIIYAQLYEEAPKGTNPERDAWVRRQTRYIDAVEDKRNAYTDFMTAQTWYKCVWAEVDAWRTEQANNRFLDKAHQ